MSTASCTPSLTPSRSSSPEPPVQPDHFYGSANIQLPPSPHSDGKTWLTPGDDPLAHRGIPVFKPTMEEFEDFEQYMTKIECWGTRSGIVKVIPPREWTDALPPLKRQLTNVKIKTPIEQHMFGRGGLFRQENIEKRKIMSVREWTELCGKDDFRAPGIDDVGLHARSANVKAKTKKTKKKVDLGKADGAEPDTEIEVKDELVDEDQHMKDVEHTVPQRDLQTCVASPPDSAMEGSPATPKSVVDGVSADAETKVEDKDKSKSKRPGQSKEAREANLAERAARDLAFLEVFDPHVDWLPPNTKPSDYTPDFCQKLERQFWRNCGLGKPAWYGADTQGSLYTEQTKSWNVASLPSTLSRLLPPGNGLPGVNTPYLYFGMWRATFAWHVEDMDLFSINYIHFGAPKFWYAMPQGRASALEQTMRGYFPKDTSRCSQFLRHKSFLASPTLLAQSSCRPNHLVQHAGEFVITFPRGYHAGFNLGLNCAESVNFALDSWIELGKRAKACECISDSVRINVEQLLRDRALEANEQVKFKKQKKGAEGKPKSAKKRKSDGLPGSPQAKKHKGKPTSASASPHEKSAVPKISLTLKLGPRPPELEEFLCCLCISTCKEGLLPVHDPPFGRKEIEEAAGKPKTWMAHESCANIIPETWVDDIEETSGGTAQKYVFGVDAIVKDRWNLKCSACTKTRQKAHGAPVQCTKGKCSKAFHVSCAREGHDAGIVFTVLREVEKEVVLVDPTNGNSQVDLHPMQVDGAPLEQSSSTTVDATIIAPEQQPLVPASRVLKVVKKQEVEILCTQHNPIVAAAKKANKQDKIRSDLLALPSMARIKIRVSAGVFEVSLIRVIEETKSVEVLWDRGIKREFKWGSVVFGSTVANVQQKPSEIIAESEQNHQSVPVNMRSAAADNTLALASGSASSLPPRAGTMAGQYSTGGQYYYPTPAGPYDYWSYQGARSPYTANGPHPYTYAGYYATAGSMNHNSYMYNANPYRPGQNQLSWQQPYQGPRSDGPADPSGTADTRAANQSQPEMQSAVLSDNSTSTTSSGNANLDHDKPMGDPAPRVQAESAVIDSADGSEIAQTKQATIHENEQGIIKDLVALSNMQPSQIAEALRDNPQLRDIVWAAVDEAKKAAAAVATPS
ncbi:hypothetical protein AX17_001779 [Amanita inopinata Kibby_2008]|nr:hypothetical protein AX17_001779 [Amanita inopinata Kibby_2008]